MASTSTLIPWHSRVARMRTSHGEELRLHYLDCPAHRTVHSSGVENGTVVLIHGFPQTFHQFRHVILPIAKAGYRVIVPDYHGAGGSSHPANPDSYTKVNMAADIHSLLHDHVEVDFTQSSVHLIGHDIGGKIAYAYAARYPEDVASIIWGECFLPGSSSFERYKSTAMQFHFVLHQIDDLPEALVTGRERIYLEHFFDKLSFDRSAISKDDVDIYVNAYSKPGALRAAFNVYRAFDKDADDNRKWLTQHGKCGVRNMCLSGSKSKAHAESAKSLVTEMFQQESNGSVREVKNAGHYIAEENPQRFVQEVLEFLLA